MHSKVSSDWLPSYIKTTRPVLEIFEWLDTFRTDLVFYIIHSAHYSPISTIFLLNVIANSITIVRLCSFKLRK